jgi:hypothetical protein
VSKTKILVLTISAIILTGCTTQSNSNKSPSYDQIALLEYGKCIDIRIEYYKAIYGDGWALMTNLKKVLAECASFKPTAIK